jgi:hypothetical protein
VTRRLRPISWFALLLIAGAGSRPLLMAAIEPSHCARTTSDKVPHCHDMEEPEEASLQSVSCCDPDHGCCLRSATAPAPALIFSRGELTMDRTAVPAARPSEISFAQHQASSQPVRGPPSIPSVYS